MIAAFSVQNVFYSKPWLRFKFSPTSIKLLWFFSVVFLLCWVYFFLLFYSLRVPIRLRGAPRTQLPEDWCRLRIFPLLAGRSATTSHRLASECHSGAVQSISLYQLLRVMKVRIELYITSSHTPTEQLLQLKRRTTQRCGARRGREGERRGEQGAEADHTQQAPLSTEWQKLRWNQCLRPQPALIDW